MRKTVGKVWGLALAGVAGLAASTLVPGGAPDASANGNKKSGNANGPGNGPAAMSTTHQSVLRISERDVTQTKSITIGRNKSMLIELPRDLRDVVVSAPDLVDAVVQSSNRVYLIGKKQGQSNAFFFDATGEQILTLEIMVEQDTTALDVLFRRLLPGSNVKSEMLNDTVILTGSVRSPTDATRAMDIASRFIVTDAKGDSRATQKVINMLAVEGEEQVMLRVVVAEVQRSILKQFGVNLGATLNSGNSAIGLLTDNALPLTSAAGLGTLGRIGIATANINNTPGTAGNVFPYLDSFPGAGDPVANSGVAGSQTFGNNKISHTIRAMERDGLLRTLAEPNLTAISGETAKFLAGGEYPVPVVDPQNGLSVSFKEFGVAVAFTPVVLSEGRISLKIETEVSELTNTGAIVVSGISIPALKKRQAKSTVELPSGGSLALAGLIQDDVRQNIDGLPGLKDLPILGTLFRSRDFIKAETELVIIVTPYLVRPTARHNLARPDDGLAAATDMKANFLGHLNRIYGKGQSTPDGGLKGDYGFIVE